MSQGQSRASGEVDRSSEDGAPVDDLPAERQPLPWHIKVLGVAFAVYVLLRLVQMGEWLIRWLTER